MSEMAVRAPGPNCTATRGPHGEHVGLHDGVAQHREACPQRAADSLPPLVANTAEAGAGTVLFVAVRADDTPRAGELSPL